MDQSALLRPGLLDGRTIALGGGGPFAASLAVLGATTATLPQTLDEQEATAHVRGALASHGALELLVHDLRPAFGGGGHDGLRAALDGAWVTVRAVANAAWIEPGRPGRIVLVAPAPPGTAVAPAPAGAAAPPAPPGTAPDPHADAVRGAVENIARTLSIEWSRHGIRTVAITPGARTTDGQLAALAAYLASPAGDYFSGARLALGEAPAPPPPD
jgi:NAD(P)-dependent dehydrogenase (short-subunit alcohol dehydrogenase family)